MRDRSSGADRNRMYGRRGRIVAALALLMLLGAGSGCRMREADTIREVEITAVDTEAEEPLPDALPEEDSFTVSEVPDEVFERMLGISYPPDCPVPREDLRYLRVLYVDFDGNVQEGELICNYRIACDLISVFRNLYRESYPIGKIRLIDDYGAADELSMEDNNTSCFNYRTLAYSERISKHGLGLAVDVNPLYNPFVTEVDGVEVLEPVTAADYADRTKEFPHKIDRDDLCFRLFTERGFMWGGDWEEEQDYQHFELPDEAAALWYDWWAAEEAEEESAESEG